MPSFDKLKALLPPLIPKEQKALDECGGYTRSIRHHGADVVIETRRCRQVAICRSCAISSASLGLHSVRSNAEAIFAKNQKSKLYLLTLTLPPSALVESRQSAESLKAARAAVRKALGGLCVGDAWVVESIKVDDDIASETAAHTHMHVLLHMHKSINSGRGYLSDAAFKSLLDAAIGGGSVGYDLRHVKPRSWLSEAHQQAIMRFGYSNESGYFAMYSYVFKSALDEIEQNGQDYYTAYRRQLKSVHLRGSSGSLGGMTKPVPFSSGLKPEAGEMVKRERRMYGGEIVTLSEEPYDPVAEKALRDKRAAARRARKGAPQRIADAAKRVADDAAAASERKNAARLEKYHARKSVASISLRDIFYAQNAGFGITKRRDWIPAPALLKESTAKAALRSLTSLFSSSFPCVFVRRKYEIKQPRDDPSAQKTVFMSLQETAMRGVSRPVAKVLKKNFRRKKIDSLLNLFFDVCGARPWA